MFPIIWLAASLVWAARTVPTASSKSGTLACCTASTGMFRTVSGDGAVRVCSLEQPARLTTASSTKKRKSGSGIHTIHGITTGDCGFKLPLANSRLA